MCKIFSGDVGWWTFIPLFIEIAVFFLGFSANKELHVRKPSKNGDFYENKGINVHLPKIYSNNLSEHMFLRYEKWYNLEVQ